MKHEKIIKREDGTQVKIDVSAYVARLNDLVYKTMIFTKQPKKRTWIHVQIKEDWNYRSLSTEQRQEKNELHKLNFVTAEELNQAKIELWEKLKP